MSRLKEKYQNEIVDALMKKFGYKNIMEVPKLDKVVINMGVGEAKENAKLLEAAAKPQSGENRASVLCRRTEQYGGGVRKDVPVPRGRRLSVAVL